MTEKIRKLMAERAKIVTDQRALLDKAEEEKRELGVLCGIICRRI